MALARVFVLVVCAALAMSGASAEGDLMSTLHSDQRFKILAKALVDTQEVDAVRDRANGSSPFVFIAHTDDAFKVALGTDGLACISRPENVKNEFVQILRFMEVVSLRSAVKTAADLINVAVDGKLQTINGMPIFVEQTSSAGQQTIVLNGDADMDEFSVTVAEVRPINENATLVVVANGFLLPDQLDEQITIVCFGADESASAPSSGAPKSAPSSSKPPKITAPASKAAPSSSKSANPASAASKGSQNGGRKLMLVMGR